MKEIFKKIPNFKDYQVSNFGRIKSLKKNNQIILKPHITKKGYLRVGLYNDKKYKIISVHQLVAIAFLNHKPNGNKIVVDHINNNKSDNNVLNLQLITNRENYIKDRKSKKLLGAYYNKKMNQWYSRINKNGKDIYLGTFKNEIECHRNYILAYYGF